MKMALNMQKTVSQLRYDNTWTGKHKIQCCFKHSKWSTRLTILWNSWKDDTWDAPLAFQDLPEEISITLLTSLNRNYSVFRNLVPFNCFIYLYFLLLFSTVQEKRPRQFFADLKKELSKLRWQFLTAEIN